MREELEFLAMGYLPQSILRGAQCPICPSRPCATILPSRKSRPTSCYDGSSHRQFCRLQPSLIATGHAICPVHAKGHGLLEGELTVLADLPSELGQGVFARPGTYPVYMRFSTSPGDLLPDGVSTPRGLAIKVLEVEGARLPVLTAPTHGRQDAGFRAHRGQDLPSGRTPKPFLKE